MSELYPAKKFHSTTPREGKMCGSKLKLEWSAEKEGWEVHPDAIPCEVMRKICILLYTAYFVNCEMSLDYCSNTHTV